jgi:hypothetical protein
MQNYTEWADPNKAEEQVYVFVNMKKVVPKLGFIHTFIILKNCRPISEHGPNLVTLGPML